MSKLFFQRAVYPTLLAVALTSMASANDAPGRLEIDVSRSDNDKVVPAAVIRVQDKAAKGPVSELKSDGEGKAVIPQLEEGDYYIEVLHPDFSKETSYLKVAPNQTNRYRALLDLAGTEKVYRVKASRLVTEDPLDGALVKRDRDFVQTQLGDTSIQGVLQTVPGVQRNSLGQTHVRGDHRSLTFSVDDLALPPVSTSSVTNPIDLDFFDSFDFRTGNYSGSQRGQAGLVFDVKTDWNRKGSFFELRPLVGNNGQSGAMVRFGGSTTDESFKYFIGAKTGQTDLGMESPTPNAQTLNNLNRNTSLLARFKARIDSDEFGLTASHVNNSFQLPQTQNNFDAGVRQNQNDFSTAVMGTWKHPIDEKSELLMGLAYVKNRQLVGNNGIFTNQQIFDAGASEELAEEGLPANPLMPGSPYLPTTALTLEQIQPTMRYTHRFSDKHTLVAGIDADFIHSNQKVDILDMGGGGGLPDAVPVFSAQVKRNAFLGGMFFSHTVPLTDTLSLNYGLRLDRFNNGVGLETGQISPSVNLGWTPTADDALRVSYNRLFQAPPLELDVSGQTSALPQRVSMFELSYERHIGSGVTGKIAYVNKSYRDQLDTGLLVPGSGIPLFAPVNFDKAKYEGVELSVNTHNKLGFNGFLSATFATAKPIQVDPAVPVPTYNDHDQRIQVAAGLSHRWDNGVTVAGDVNYGSGYPQEALALYRAAGLNPYGYTSDRIPRFISNLSFTYFPPEESDGIQAGASVKINNLFDSRPLMNFLSEFSGTRFYNQRSVMFQGLFRF